MKIVIIHGQTHEGSTCMVAREIARKVEGEIRELCGASEEDARKIETLWQEIMQAYLPCAVSGELVRAAHSSHYIHLTDPDLICGLLQ